MDNSRGCLSRGNLLNMEDILLYRLPRPTSLHGAWALPRQVCGTPWAPEVW